MNISRRGFIAAAAGLAGATVLGVKLGAQYGQEAEHHGHEEVSKRKQEILKGSRAHLEEVLKLGKSRLKPFESKLLFNPESPLDFGCMDEREEVPAGHNKLGIAGVGAKMTTEQELDFVARAKKDSTFGPRVQYSVGHEGCAAHGKDDAKAEQAAARMARHFDLPASHVKMAKFDAKGPFRMQGNTPEDRHIHPGMIGVLDTGADFMEGNFGTVIGNRDDKLEELPNGKLPAFEIYAGKNIDAKYVGTQVGIMRQVYEGAEGMYDVSKAPFILVVTGTRKEIDRVISEQADIIKTFATKPHIVEIES